MDKLKVGIIGIGGMGRIIHLPALVKHPNVEVTVLCDIVLSKAEEQAEIYGIKKVCADYKEVTRDKDIDAIFITTPNYLHSIIAVDALENGKNVFCEKPDAVNVEEVLKMKAASEKSGKLLMVMRNNRFREESRYLRRFIDDGGMGEIYAARCGWIRRRGIPGKGGWFTTKAQSGGGPLIDLGVHMIDLAIWLMGNPRPVSVVGSTYRKFADNQVDADSEHATFGEKKAGGTFDVEDMAIGFIKFDNGTSLSIEFSWASNIGKERNFVELMGTKAGAKLQSVNDEELTIYGESNGTIVNIAPIIQKNPNAPGDHAKNINHFIDCLVSGAKPVFVPQQGVDMIKILMAVYKSAETGREVLLED